MTKKFITRHGGNKNMHLFRWLLRAAVTLVTVFALVIPATVLTTVADGTASVVHAKEQNTTLLALKYVRTLKNDFVVNRLAWHPDGRHLAIGQNLNKKVVIWDITSGKTVRTIESEAGGVGALAYSPDGKYLAVGRIATRHTPDHAHVHLYNVVKEGLVRKFVPPAAEKGDANDVGALTFSPDSRRLVTHGYAGGAVGVVYALPSGNVIAKLDPSTRLTDAVRALNWSPNGRWVAIGRISGRLELWNTASWKLEKLRDVSRQRIDALVFSPDNSRVAFGSMKVTAEQAELAAKDIAKSPESFRRNQRIPSAAPYDLRLLDTTSLSDVGGFASSHNGSAIKELAFTPDGKYLISGANADSVAVHEVTRGTEVIFLNNLKPSAHPVPSLNGKYVAVGVGENIQIYEFRH